MRAALIMALCLGAAGCGVEPGTPPVAGAHEMAPRPGLLSGPSGDFLIIGSDPAAAEEPEAAP